MAARAPTTGNPPADGNATAAMDGYVNTSSLAKSQLALARELQNILTDTSRSRRAATFAAASRSLTIRRTMVAEGLLNTSAGPALARQQTKLRGARELLETQADNPGTATSLSESVELTETAFKLQIARTQTTDEAVEPRDVAMPHVETPSYNAPSTAAIAVLEVQNVSVTEKRTSKLRALDALPDSTRRELTDVLEAYLAYYRTVQTSAGDDNRHIRAAQLRLLEATADLEAVQDGGTARGNSESGSDEPGANQPALHGPGRSPVQVAGLISIDLSTADTTYSDDYNLQIDMGGDDTYTNNAGGANASGNATDVAALLDLGGRDMYAGRNGGARYTVTEDSPTVPSPRAQLSKQGEAAGMLFDAGVGNDTYTAAKQRATNGGGQRALGLLVDGGGSDVYDAKGSVSNGGGFEKGQGMLLDAGTGDDTYAAGATSISNGAGRRGHGFLFDGGGNDTYDGTNGFATGKLPTKRPVRYGRECDKAGPGTSVKDPACKAVFSAPDPPATPNSGGFLVDAGGSDSYVGPNGAAGSRGAGFLLDAGTGDDTYEGTHSDRYGRGPTNGGAYQAGASGFLLDLGGGDAYLAEHTNENGGGCCGGVGFLMDGGTGNDTYDATTGGGPAAGDLPPGSRGTNGGAWRRGHGFLVDGGGNDDYSAGSVGTNGGTVRHAAEYSVGNSPILGKSTGFLVDVGGDDRYAARKAGVNGGAVASVGLLYDNNGTDRYAEGLHRCLDCSDVPKGSIGAQIDRDTNQGKSRRPSLSSEVLIVDDTARTADPDCSDASYESIQRAVNEAEPGDTVRVCAGTYPGNVTVDTFNVTLEAADPGQVVLDGEHERRFGIALVAGHSTATGFTATNFSKANNRYPLGDRAAFLSLGPKTSVTNSIVRNSSYGIIAAGVYTDSGLLDIPNTDTKPRVIANNTITGTKFGIGVVFTANVNISHNEVRESQRGIYVFAGAEANIHANTVSGGRVPMTRPQSGIVSLLSKEITMTGNTVTGFTAPEHWQRDGAFSYGYGIAIRSPSGSGSDVTHTLRNNSMANNKFNLLVNSNDRGDYKHFTIDPTNTVNGQPVFYLVDAVDLTIGPGPTLPQTGGPAGTEPTRPIDTTAIPESTTPGYVACIRCVNVTVQDLSFENNGQGVLIVRSKRVRVRNVSIHETVWGIEIEGSPTDVEVTNNAVRQTKTAISIKHDCEEPHTSPFDTTVSGLGTRNKEICTKPSVVIANNTIRKSAAKYGSPAHGYPGFGGAIEVTGSGVTVRDNTISHVTGAGISVHPTGPPVRLPDENDKFPDLIYEQALIDNTISDANVGISVRGTRNTTTIAKNTIADSAVGLFTVRTRQPVFRDNVVTNSSLGMFVDWSNVDIQARNNSFRGVKWGLDVRFTLVTRRPRAPGTHDFGTSNTVNGERIIWLHGADHRTIDATDANMVVCVRCDNVVVRGMTLTDNAHGVVLWNSTDTRVTNVKSTDTFRAGVVIRGGNNNTVRNSTVIDSIRPIWGAPMYDGPESTVSGATTPNMGLAGGQGGDGLGSVRIVNNRVAVDDGRKPYRWQRLSTKPDLWGHFGIWVFNPTKATITGNNVTDNRWGIAAMGGRPSELRIENNTVDHARSPLGTGRYYPDHVTPLGAVQGIYLKMLGRADGQSNGRIAIRNNTFTAGTYGYGGIQGLHGITVFGRELPSTVIADNSVQGYQSSLRIGMNWDNATISVRRNRLTGANGRSVLIYGQTPGDAVEIHQNLLNPTVGFGVKSMLQTGSPGFHSSMMSMNHFMPHNSQPVDATCNQWAAPSGPSSRNRVAVDPVTGEPADGNGSWVSYGKSGAESNVRFHPWLGDSPRLSCGPNVVGTPTPTPIPTPTRTPWPTLGQGEGDGPGPGDGNGPGPTGGNETVPGGEGTVTVTAPAPVTATPSATPPPTATPEIVPGFGLSVWVVAFVLIVGLLAVRRRP